MKINKNKKAEAITQIFILIIGIFAISWMIGGEIKVVSAAADSCTTHIICSADNLYYGKTSSGKCVADVSNLKQDCPIYGCTEGDTICNLQPKEKSSVTGNDILGGLEKGAQGYLLGNQVYNTLVKSSTGKELAKEGAKAASKTVTGDTTKKTLLEKLIPGAGKGAYVLRSISGAFFWSSLAYTIINYFAKKYASQRNASDISTAALIGAGAGIATVIVAALIVEAGSGPIGWIAGVITVVVAGLYMVVGYQDYSREVFNFMPSLWQPQSGGTDCNKCNSLTVAGENECSEYICHSYGLSCEFINNETAYQTCIEVNKGDISAPIITPAKEIYGANVFPSDKYDYKTSSAGTKIVYSGDGGDIGQCIPAFTSVKLALKTDEYAYCKVTYNEPANGTTNLAKFGNMIDMAEANTYTKNHTLLLPPITTASIDALDVAGYELTNGGNYKFYIRCEDKRGNVNSMDYLMSFCVQSGPDTTPPEIIGTLPEQDSFEPYGIDKVENFQVYTNEPSDCKWDFQSKDYQFMSYNFDTCSQTINDNLRGFDFGCQVNLTGFKNGVENKYYIACMDQPQLKGTVKEDKRNAGDPYTLTLKGTSKLLIDGVKINGEENGTTISDGRNPVNVNLEVSTFGGAEEGKARCKYSDDKVTYSLFENGNSRDYIYPNTQSLYLGEGVYKYYLQCFDDAGNSAETMINFSVKIDNSAPIVVRVYKDGDNLKLITDEPGQCVYATFGGCTYSFDEGTLMDSMNDREYSIQWKTDDTYYIKCKDKYDKQPVEGECSIIVRPYEIPELQ